MHRVLSVGLLTVVASTATARQEPPGAPITYTSRYSDLSSSEANVAFLGELRKKIEAAGYSDVNIDPGLFFATAMDSTGNPVGLMVDSDSETTVELDGQGAGLNKLACGKADQKR